MLFNSVIVGAKGAAAEDAAALARVVAESAGGAQVSEARVPDGESVGRGLHDAAVELKADLIVIGSSSRGILGRILAGDDVIATLRGAPCAVAIAPRGFAAAPHALGRIGVGYDGSPQAQAALAAARALAGDATEILALGVATPPQGLVTPLGVSAVAAIEARRDQIEKCIGELEHGIEGRVVDGIAPQRLAELSGEVDLLIVGSSQRGRVGRVLLGSTSETLSREASCPLLVIPAPDA